LSILWTNRRAVLSAPGKFCKISACSLEESQNAPPRGNGDFAFAPGETASGHQKIPEAVKKTWKNALLSTGEIFDSSERKI